MWPAPFADIPDVRFLIVGDGELRESLTASAEATGLGDQLVWAGFRRDMSAVYFASDVVVQTSDNEGTPVSIIEAQAAGVPVVSTRVGGTASAVPADGLLAPVGDENGLARATQSLLQDPDQAASAAGAGRAHVLARFDLARLLSDLDALYKTSTGAGRR